jgi:Ca2+-transporting ATPase
MIGFLSLTAYLLALYWGRTVEEAHTMTFITMAMSQIVHSFNVRNMNLSLFTIGFGTNRSLIYAFITSAAALLVVVFIPFLREVFETVMLRPSDWVLVLGLSLMPLALVEISKLIFRTKPASGEH